MKEVLMRFENEELYLKFLDLVIYEQLAEQEQGLTKDTYIEFNQETNICLVKENSIEQL